MSLLAPLTALVLAAVQTESKPIPVPPPFLPDPKAAVQAAAASLPHPVTDHRSAERARVPDADPIRVPTGLVDWSRVHLDEPGDGRVWARGRTYKASFGVEGATYIPFLGSRAPRNFPVRVGVLASDDSGELDPAVRGVTRREQSVVLDRGSFREVWHLGTAQAEQTFEFDARPAAAGGVTIRLLLDTQLALRAEASGFALDGAHGGVRIGSATAIDADGRRLDLVTRAEDNGLAITLPADFVASARYPLVVDPVYTTFALEGWTEECYLPDVAGGDGDGNFAAAYSMRFSASDDDVYSLNLWYGTPLTGTGVWVDSTDDSWGRARLAYNALHRTYLTVANVVPVNPPGATVQVWCRARYAPTSSQWGRMLVHAEAGGSDYYVDVGGDPALVGPTFYLAVWSRTYSLVTDSDIQARLIDSFGNPVGGTIYLESSSAYDWYPRISKTNGRPPLDTQRWTVAWTRATGNDDAWGAQLTWDGIVAAPAFPISDSFLVDETFPAPSSLLDGDTGPRPYLVAYTRSSGGVADIAVRVMAGTSTLASANLSALEGLDPARGQSWPEADSNGQRFVVSYNESGGTAGSADSFLATVAYAEGAIRVDEAHVPIETGPGSTFGVEISGCITTSNQGIAWYAVAWSENVPGADDAFCGAYYEPDLATLYCIGDGSYGNCPCANFGTHPGGCANSVTNGAVLMPTGSPFTTADSFTLTATDMPSTVPCLFFQGTAASAPGTAFGDGLRCAGGTILRIGSKTASAGVATYPEAGDLAISVRGLVPAGGAQRYYQVWYRNAAAFCTASTFNTTNGVSVRWLR